jgi:hypothetical protein
VPAGNQKVDGNRAGTTAAKEPPWWQKLLALLLRLLSFLIGAGLVSYGTQLLGISQLLAKLSDFLKAGKPYYPILSAIGGILMLIGALVPPLAWLVPIGLALTQLGLGLSLAANLSKPFSDITGIEGGALTTIGLAMEGDPSWQQADQLTNEKVDQLQHDWKDDIESSVDALVESGVDIGAGKVVEGSGIEQKVGKGPTEAVGDFVSGEITQLIDAAKAGIDKLTGAEPEGEPTEGGAG